MESMHQQQQQQQQQQASACAAEVAWLDDFVDAWKPNDQLDSQSNDATSTASDDLDRSPCASPAATTCKHIRSKSSPSRALSVPKQPKFASTSVRRKHEMAGLRREEEALLTQLVLLQQEADARSASSGSASDTAAVAASRQIAQHKYVQLQRAQRTNVALRASATDNKRMIERLQRILFKRAASRSIVESTLLAPLAPERAELAFATDRTAVFAQLVAGLHDMYTRTNSVLAAMARELPVDSSEYRRWHVHRNADTDALEVEVVHCYEMPFRRADVSRVSRMMYHEQKTNTSELDPQDFGGAPSMKMVEASARYSAPSVAGVYRLRHASRTFETADRTLSLSIAYVDSADAAKPLPGIVLKDEQWVVLTEREYVNAHTGEVQYSTIIHAYSRITPVVTRGAQQLHCWDRATVEDRLIPAWDQVISFAQQTIENKLIDLVGVTSS